MDSQLYSSDILLSSQLLFDSLYSNSLLGLAEKTKTSETE